MLQTVREGDCLYEVKAVYDACVEDIKVPIGHKLIKHLNKQLICLEIEELKFEDIYMKIRLLGTGSAFTIKNWQTNLLIETKNSNLLIDCGTDCRRMLDAYSLSFGSIENVYISHAHDDHVGGLGEFALFNKFMRQGNLPNLYTNELLVDDIWASMRPGVATLQNELSSLGSYFNVFPIIKNKSFDIDGINFLPLQVMHVYDGYRFQPSFGLIISTPDKKVLITTDTQFSSQLLDFYKDVDMIFNDCEVGFKSGVHAHFDDLTGLAPEIKSKMILIHYNDDVIDNLEEWQTKATNAGFLGFGGQGEEFTL